MNAFGSSTHFRLRSVARFTVAASTPSLRMPPPSPPVRRRAGQSSTYLALRRRNVSQVYDVPPARGKRVARVMLPVGHAPPAFALPELPPACPHHQRHGECHPAALYDAKPRRL